MEIKMRAEVREGAGKGVARKTRAAGKVPAVMYGSGMDPVKLTVDARELWHALHTDAGSNVLIDLAVDGDSFLAMPRQIQRDILKGTFVHVDFLQVRTDVAIEVEIPVHLVGESHGVREGGVVEHHLWELRVEVLPTAVPESVEADITDLGIGDTFTVAQLAVPEGVTVLSPEDEVIVTVVPPPVLKLEEEAAEEAAEEVEGEAPATEVVESADSGAEELGGAES
ncbi:MAG: 50S ribosomal protein L25 [Actinomycetota bacterium]|nr:50S ribosomal protein L25 [Actinomycetota bacterium]